MWNVPVDHEMFGHINLGQWYWYFYNFLKDEEEKHIHQRDLAEYLASFSNPEAVQQVRRSRKDAVKVSDSDFTTGLQNVFGRKLPAKLVGSDGKIHATAPFSEKNQIAKQNEDPSYKDWMKIDLE